MGCPDDWNTLCPGFLSDKRSFLFRYAYTDVCNGYSLPVVFAIATALPVLAVAWILAFSVQQMGSFYGKMQKVQKWMNLIVGVVFIIIGIYYCWIMYL